MMTFDKYVMLVGKFLGFLIREDYRCQHDAYTAYHANPEDFEEYYGQSLLEQGIIARLGNRDIRAIMNDFLDHPDVHELVTQLDMDVNKLRRADPYDVDCLLSSAVALILDYDDIINNTDFTYGEEYSSIVQ